MGHLLRKPGQLLADPPESSGDLFITRFLRRLLLFLLREVFSAYSFHVGRRRQIDRGLGSSLRSHHEESHEFRDEARPTEGSAPDVCRDRAGVKTIRGNACSFQPPRKLVSEEHLRELSLRVGPPAAVTLLALEVIEIYVPVVVSDGRDFDEPRGCGGFQQVDQKPGEEEVREVIDFEGGFESVSCSRSPEHKEPRIIDEYVQPIVLSSELARELTNRLHR